MTSSRNPNSDGDGVGSAAQNGIGAVVEWLERWDHVVVTTVEGGATRGTTANLGPS
jgi:hypothetical protein